MRRKVKFRGGPRSGEVWEPADDDVRVLTYDPQALATAADGRLVHTMVTYCATGEMDGEHEVWVVGADEGTTP